MPALEVGATHCRLLTAYADTDVRPRAPGGSDAPPRATRRAGRNARRGGWRAAGPGAPPLSRRRQPHERVFPARSSTARTACGAAAVAAAQEGPTAAVALGQLGDHGQQAVDLAGLDSGRSAEPALDAEAAQRTGDGRVGTAELRRDRVSRPALEFVPLAQPVLIVQFPIAERHQGDVLARHQAQPYAGGSAESEPRHSPPVPHRGHFRVWNASSMTGRRTPVLRLKAIATIFNYQSVRDVPPPLRPQVKGRACFWVRKGPTWG